MARLAGVAVEVTMAVDEDVVGWTEVVDKSVVARLAGVAVEVAMAVDEDVVGWTEVVDESVVVRLVGVAVEATMAAVEVWLLVADVDAGPVVMAVEAKLKVAVVIGVVEPTGRDVLSTATMLVLCPFALPVVETSGPGPMAVPVAGIADVVVNVVVDVVVDNVVGVATSSLTFVAVGGAATSNSFAAEPGELVVVVLVLASDVVLVVVLQIRWGKTPWASRHAPRDTDASQGVDQRSASPLSATPPCGSKDPRRPASRASNSSSEADTSSAATAAL
mmetsp:Transcript_63542/g.197175  ORF Transcript_63542/g.197175 Transcript_63542/m.197175 type:complete len:276 (-) Transcript_63542:74-901(-)